MFNSGKKGPNMLDGKLCPSQKIAVSYVRFNIPGVHLVVLV